MGLTRILRQLDPFMGRFDTNSGSYYDQEVGQAPSYFEYILTQEFLKCVVHHLILIKNVFLIFFRNKIT